MKKTDTLPLHHLEKLLIQSAEERRHGNQTDFTARQAGFASHDELAAEITRRKTLETPKHIRELTDAANLKIGEAEAAGAAARQALLQAQEKAHFISETNRQIAEVEVVLEILRETNASLDELEKSVVDSLSGVDHIRNIYGTGLAAGFLIQQDRAWRGQLTGIHQDRIIIPARIAVMERELSDLKRKLAK